MLVQFQGSWLTNDGTGTYPERAITSAQEVKLNGKQLVQVAQFLRGTSSTPLGRGNKVNTLGFKCTRNFALINPADTNPIASAESYMLLDFWNQPQSGVLTIFCGPIGGSPALTVQSLNAVLESSPSLDVTGVKLTIEYQIECSTLFSRPPAGTPLTDQSGANLTDQFGNPLTS